VDQVDAGYEANAIYLVIPAVARTGQVPAGVDPSDLHLLHPSLVLTFAGPGDPRPGAAYQSLAPGRIVISRPPR
jgi:carbamoylphosphate synthase small subunit